MKKIFLIIIFTISIFVLYSKSQNAKHQNLMSKQNSETAIFAGGCFWCTEAIYQHTKGVESVVPGYAGGHVKNPSYEEVSQGNTGHAEAVRITYDPDKISYTDLLYIFFKTHDPTTLNRQGADVGPQYRSAIFYMNADQKAAAESIIKNLAEKGIWDDPIVTEINPYKNFYEAEDYHKDYYENNANAPYCQAVINPKLKKFKKEFTDLSKDKK